MYIVRVDHVTDCKFMDYRLDEIKKFYKKELYRSAEVEIFRVKGEATQYLDTLECVSPVGRITFIKV